MNNLTTWNLHPIYALANCPLNVWISFQFFIIFCFFQYCEISPWILLMWRVVVVFGQCHFLWDIFILFLHPLFSFTLRSSPSLGSSSSYLESQMARISTFPGLALTPFTSYWYFTLDKFLFLAFTFVFVYQFPFLIIHFYIILCMFITRRRCNNTLCCLCVNCIQRGGDQSLTWSERRDVIG